MTLKRSVQDFFTAPEDNPFLAIVADPLSPVSRKNRSRLIGLSGVAIGIRAADLLPSQVSALGISLSLADQKWFIRFMWISIVYLLGTFVIYAILDYWAWEGNLKYRLMKFVHTNEQGKVSLDEAVEDAFNSAPTFWKADYTRMKVLMDDYVDGGIKSHQLIWRSSPMATIRLWLDLIVPVVVSVVAIVLMMTWPIRPAHQEERTSVGKPSQSVPAPNPRPPDGGAPQKPTR